MSIDYAGFTGSFCVGVNIMCVFLKGIGTKYSTALAKYPLLHNVVCTSRTRSSELKGNRHKPDLKIRFWCVYIS